MEENKARGIMVGIDLLKYENACIVPITSKATGVTKRGVFIPFEGNDIYVKKDETTGKAKCAKIDIDVTKRKELSKYGHTHYCKQILSSEFRDANPELSEKKKSIYMGDGKEYEREFSSSNDVNSVVADSVDLADDGQDNLPF